MDQIKNNNLTEEEQELWRYFRSTMHKDFCSTPAVGPTFAVRRGYESKYSHAYQTLVRNRLAPQIKKKYR